MITGEKVKEAMRGGRPIASAGSCSYEGHMCSPYLVSVTPYRDIRFWVSGEEKDKAIAALNAMWQLGYEAGLKAGDSK